MGQLNDPQLDPFKPPAIPTEVCCLHCGHEYESYLIEWRTERSETGETLGFWCCPTPGCDGKGFGFDILPTDPDYVGEDGESMWISDEDEDDADDECSDIELYQSDFDELDFDDAGDDTSADSSDTPPNLINRISGLDDGYDDIPF